MWGRERYKGLKGKYWTLLSEYIRRRDFQRYGTCISCGKAVSDWREFDAGHFIPAGSGGFSLLFDERNLNGECPYDILLSEQTGGHITRCGAGSAIAAATHEEGIAPALLFPEREMRFANLEVDAHTLFAAHSDLDAR
jgi:hypothetical protein